VAAGEEGEEADVQALCFLCFHGDSLTGMAEVVDVGKRT
jgi:hypothetical protein